MAWAELCSLLHGASMPDDLVETADAAGLQHLAITDRDGVYGLPRAHKVAKGLDLHLICGATDGCVLGDVDEGRLARRRLGTGTQA